MRRSRPRQHTRKLRNGKRVTVNKGIKKRIKRRRGNNIYDDDNDLFAISQEVLDNPSLAKTKLQNESIIKSKEKLKELSDFEQSPDFNEILNKRRNLKKKLNRRNNKTLAIINSEELLSPDKKYLLYKTKDLPVKHSKNIIYNRLALREAEKKEEEIRAAEIRAERQAEIRAEIRARKELLDDDDDDEILIKKRKKFLGIF